MTELEQLRADMATIQEAAEIAKIRGFHELACNYDQVEGELKQKIAKLEAQEQVDPWERARGYVDHALKHYMPSNGLEIAKYARHLEAKVAELDHELRCERIDGGKVRDDLRAEIAVLTAKLVQWPVSEAAEALVKEVDQFKQREKLAEQEIWIRDVEEMVDFIVRSKPNGNSMANDIARYARHLEDQLNVATIRNLRTVERLREKLAELTTIANAIPPACGLAKEFVEKRIEGVKKQLQETGAGQ